MGGAATEAFSVAPSYAPRATLTTMSMTAAADRLAAARDRLVALRPRVEAGAPWPLSPDFGAEPESTWNPPELLAHVAEMLPYWLGQIDRILAGGPGPVSFGRVQTDEDRIGAIGRDREQPIGDLYRRIDHDTDVVLARLREMTDAEAEAVGTHPTRGAMTVAAIVERMFVGHLEEHVEQLEGILAGAGR